MGAASEASWSFNQNIFVTCSPNFVLRGRCKLKPCCPSIKTFPTWSLNFLLPFDLFASF
uniref:Uncharacterized protein n=1 Tax=Arundo donax TaxID=35708 RepID=A0A0A9ELB8_ARUDO